MFQVVKNAFNSQDLPGEFLLTPLKAYHQFLAEKIQANSGLYKAAWIIVKAAALIDGDGNGGVIVRLRTFSPIDPSAVGHSRSRGQRVRVEEPDDSRALASPGASRRPDSRSSVKIEEVD